MTNNNLDKFIDEAANTAIKGAVDYIKANRPGYDIVANADPIIEAIRKRLKADLPKALDDAREAIEANMAGYASATFLSSMRLAGIEAAKECGL